MRMRWTQLAVFVLAGVWAVSANAVVNYGNTTTRPIYIYAEDTECNNLTAATIAPPAIAQAEVGCGVFAGKGICDNSTPLVQPTVCTSDLDCGAGTCLLPLFDNSSVSGFNDYWGTLSFVGGTVWRILVRDDI